MEENVITDEIVVTDGTADVQERKNKSKKITVVVTYVIALLCLLAGLLVPLFNFASVVPVSERMLIRYIPSMLNNVLVVFAKKQIIPSGIPWFIDVYAGSFDFASLVCVLYALLCVAALFMLIPVCLGSGEKKTAARCALSVEIIAAILSLAYLVYVTYHRANILGGAKVTWIDYNFLLALGGALITAFIQSVLTKGSLGTSKVFAAILSTLSVVAILDVSLIVPALSTPLSNLSNTLKGGAVAGFVDGLTVPTGMGIDGVGIIFAIKTYFSTVFGSGAYVGTLYVLLMAVAVLTLLNAACDAIGLATNFKNRKNGLPARNAFSNIFALVRYSATFVFSVLLIILAVFREGVMPGLYLYLLTLLTLFALVNAIVRTALAFARAKRSAAYDEELENTLVDIHEEYETPYAEEPAYAQPQYEQPAYAEPAFDEPVYEQPQYEQPRYEEPVYDQPAYEQPAYDQPLYKQEPEQYDQNAFESLLSGTGESDEPVADEEPEAPVAPIAEEPAAKPAPTPAPEPEPAPAPATVYVYAGDTDEFMETLTDREKVEFVDVFIKKSKGAVNGVPDYRINGDNTDFFPAVFVHINRYRDKLSDALMGKMYKQLGSMN